MWGRDEARADRAGRVRHSRSAVQVAEELQGEQIRDDLPLFLRVFRSETTYLNYLQQPSSPA